MLRIPHGLYSGEATCGRRVGLARPVTVHIPFTPEAGPCHDSEGHTKSLPGIEGRFLYCGDHNPGAIPSYAVDCELCGVENNLCPCR
jgi:hypothetical protein